MNLSKARLEAMIEQIDEIVSACERAEKKEFDQLLARVHPAFAASARNLIHYRVLRGHDLRAMQKRLGNLGLSRLAKAEGHVLASLAVTRSILRALATDRRLKLKPVGASIKESNKLLNAHAKALLGFRSKGRRTRIMVTLPSEAATDYRLVHDLVAAGMNCARVNCAHDGPDAWERMIAHVHQANERLRRRCRVAMDLAGPKIRSGPMEPGPRVLRIVPDRDVRGRVLRPARVWVASAPHPSLDVAHLPIPSEALSRLSVGTELFFTDLRDRQRRLQIVGAEANGCWADCYRTAYLEPGTLLTPAEPAEAEPIPVGEVPPVEQTILLHVGDTLRIHAAQLNGEPAVFDPEGRMLREAHIACTAPEIFGDVQVGEPILFDDGKIGGVVRERSDEELRVEIVQAREAGGKLRADKGINLPASRLGFSGLTAKDREDLRFIAGRADAVSLSFVNSEADVQELIDELARLDSGRSLGLIVKIETRRAFNALTEILLTAMQVHPVGVMIARGDLAVESGWENMARVQQEILALCQAAHVPDIWATQVLENLAKKGIPSRAEITDAAMSQRAECVMLNKGPQILEAIRLLDGILKDMVQYQDKNAPMTPPLAGAAGG